MTHKQLVSKAKAWLTRQCRIVITELVTNNIEIPDAIGFCYTGKSILLECKVSRNDFIKDKDKLFRTFEEQGMGNERYYLTPEGLLGVDEIPQGWGLLELHSHRIVVKQKPDYKEANKNEEVKFLSSIIRRLQLSTCVYVVNESDEQN